MTSLVLDRDPVAVSLTVTETEPRVGLADGRSLSVPLSWYPRLRQGSKAERRNWQLLSDGYATEWPDLDEHIGVEGLLAGHCSRKSQPSLNRWLAPRGQEAKKPVRKRAKT